MPVPPASPVVSVSRKSHCRGSRDFLRRAGSEQAERGRINFLLWRVQCEAVSDGFRKPPAQAEVFAKSVSPRRGAQNFSEAAGAGGNVGRNPRVASLGSVASGTRRWRGLGWSALSRLRMGGVVIALIGSEGFSR